MTQTRDAIDQAAGLTHQGAVWHHRQYRPEFVSGAAACRQAVLHPDIDLGLSAQLRAAVARRIALTGGNIALRDAYATPDDADLQAFSDGRPCDDPALHVLAGHVDMIANDPKAASSAHLQRLQDAGYSTAQIVALSELCAYVCFQIRLAHGLALLEDLS
ncbi:hypothetical protein BFP70_10455 [Thioclava sp. SK-1]|uniref:hypothetical protein n=1 Tax=Thioclava sp. SK-1 TaxID=1889770 RepID=UPI00082542CE|nr:hypothetical protein [Thioclava sp. SK-1]OCX64466.1 hypothetical protein BFP70_10455 [Thioclava sp. SK-1]